MAQKTMAPFIGKQLIQHLVTSNPSPAYIQRVAGAFSDNGSGVAGDMKAVITAILTDPEARAGDDPSAAIDPSFGHMREPVLFVANLLRGLNATLGTSSTVYNNATSLGQDLFYPPTVFSYFSPLYTLESGEPAPEFQIYSGQTALNRANTVNAILYGTLDKSTTVDLTPFEQGDVSSMVGYDQLRISASPHVERPEASGHSGRQRRERREGSGAGRALHRADVGRIPDRAIGRMSMFSRRNFIRIGAASLGTLALRRFAEIPAMAQSSSNYRALVCVFLYGGNDSNNTIIPMDDASYKAYLGARASLALQASALTQAQSASGAPYGFFSPLAEVASLFSSKELAVVANVGSLVQPITRAQYQAAQAPIPANLFSHADQQQQWQSSMAQGNSPTGWGGRVADYVAAQKLNSSGFPTFLSVAGNTLEGSGANTHMLAIAPGSKLALAGFDGSAASQARAGAFANLLTLNSGVSLAQAANSTMSMSLADAKALSDALGKAPGLKTQFPASSLGAQLQQVAQIIQVQSSLGMQRQVFFCSIGSFDTHTGELPTLNTLYPELSQALAAFYNATQEIGMAQNVTTFTESDFNRTFQPTTGDGSDHAWGGHHLVLGGAVQGGEIYGSFPTFELGGPDDTDTRGRWIPTTSIDQYGATLCSWFGIPDSAMNAIFPNLANFSTRKLGFLG